MPVPNLRPLGFGEILDGAFSLYRRNMVTFVVTALLPLLGVMAGGVVMALFVATGGAAWGVIGWLGIIILVVLAFMVQWGALTHQASETFLSAPVAPMEAVRAGIGSMFRLLGALFMVGITLSLTFLIAIFLIGMLAMGIESLGIRFFSILLGFAMIFGGIVLYFGAAAVVAGAGPVIVVEGRGPGPALSRSVELMRGAFWRMVALVAVTVTITYLPMIAILFVTGTTESFTSTDAALPETGALLVQQLLTWMVGLVAAPFIASVFVLSYYDRRVRTEALDVQMMTESLALAGD
jgi:hypothetical protein